MRYGVVELPVLVSLARKTGTNSSDEARIAPNFGFMSSFQHLKSQLDVLAPLSIQFPFLVLGLSEASPLLASVTELDADPNVVSERVVIDRCIEFHLSTIKQALESSITLARIFARIIQTGRPKCELSSKV